jgi:hypothetical protein
MARLAAVMSIADDWPGVHMVPAAKDWTTDQVPEAHCWNEVPPTQFQRPSGVQAEPAVIAPDVPEDAVGEADALATGAAEVAAAGALVEVAMVVATALLAAAVVAKTPGALAVDVMAGAADVAVAPEDPEA